MPYLYRVIVNPSHDFRFRHSETHLLNSGVYNKGPVSRLTQFSQGARLLMQFSHGAGLITQFSHGAGLLMQFSRGTALLMQFSYGAGLMTT
jgi:hypothetical protein